MKLEEKGRVIPEYTRVRILFSLIKHCQPLSGPQLMVEVIAGVHDARQFLQSLTGPPYIS